MAGIEFLLKCKICGKLIATEENPIEHMQKHAEEELLNYFDAVPSMSLKE